MPTIPRRAIDEYTRGVNAATASATELMLTELESVDWDAPVAEIRDRLIEIMQACCESAANVSAVVASEFYDAAREHAIGSTMGATAEAGYDPRGTEGAVRAFVQNVVDGRPDAPERVARKCAERIDWEAKRAAANSIKANARRDRAKPRYARVPSGSETCEFCLMLASRGPVYHSADSAGEGNHFHANCDCRIVPVWDSHREVTDAGGVIRRGGTQIEGYDPDAYYERYVRAMLDPDFRSKVRASADGASGSRESWSGKFARQKMLNNLSNWQESFAKARSMDELQAMVSDVSAFLDESGMGRAMSHAQWEVLRSNLLAARRRLEALSDSPSEVRLLRQTETRVAIPSSYDGNYDDFRPLELDDAEISSLKTLNRLAGESGHEHAQVISGESVGEPFTSGYPDRVRIQLGDISGDNLRLLHSHTNVTPLSREDFSYLCNERVLEVGNVAANGDAFVARVGDGWRPTLEEFEMDTAQIARDVNYDMARDPDFNSWSIPERNYMAIREQAYRIAIKYEWELMGGNIDEL